jgi:hypothetical protein
MTKHSHFAENRESSMLPPGCFHTTKTLFGHSA